MAIESVCGGQVCPRRSWPGWPCHKPRGTGILPVKERWPNGHRKRLRRAGLPAPLMAKMAMPQAAWHGHPARDQNTAKMAVPRQSGRRSLASHPGRS